MMRKLTTKEKALKVNLDASEYGSFAEIGGGQEVAANFFKAGGASGTVAKTMSAYDMEFSNAIYGKCKRYVSKERLNTMITHEYELLIERLKAREEDTRFFALADTLECLNYKKTNQGHGWMGLRFQLHPMSEPNDCIIHVVMKDNDTYRQQAQMGIVGVNLIYGCFNYFANPEHLLNSLIDNVSPGSIEIDMFQLSGPDFEDIDNRLLALKMVKNGLSKVAMFGPDGQVIQPSNALYKKNILMLRGRFRPATLVHMDMLAKGKKQYLAQDGVDEDDTLTLAELTLSSLSKEGVIDEQDFLDRAEILCSMGLTVLISNYEEYYKLVSYLTRFTRSKLMGIILGMDNVSKIFDEQYYTSLKGGILEAFGILFGRNVKLFIYPQLNKEENKLTTSKDLELSDKLTPLYQYLVSIGKIEDMKEYNEDVLPINSDEVLKMIQLGKTGWDMMVPQIAQDKIKTKGLFYYPVQKTKESEFYGN
ncbi:MAG: TonB-dependent receptor [Bacteroidia bacterium]|nr:TonB-dependent receptor [Bacteroidia bacterium]